MSRGVSIILEIPRSANNLRENGDIGEIVNQSTMKTEGLSIFEEEYINGISNPNVLTLTVFSIFIFFNSFISSKLWTIVWETFSDYNFFCFRKRITFSSRELHSSST